MIPASWLSGRRSPWFVVLLGLALVVTWATAAVARDVPPLRSRVEDTIALLPPDAKARLEQKLAAHEQSTGQQFALLIVDTLGGDSLEDFSIRVVEAWKLGKKKKDDGLLLLVVRDDRKVRIEVGYGLEGDVTDAFSARLIRDVMTPAFRAGDFPGGIERALDALMLKASGGVPALPPEQTAKRPAAKGPSFGLAPILLFVVLPLLLPFFLRGRRRGNGTALLLGGIAGALGNRGGWNRGSGWGGGGGFGGGGGGGGGFSGGGGSFGGGGASGSW